MFNFSASTSTSGGGLKGFNFNTSNPTNPTTSGTSTPSSTGLFSATSSALPPSSATTGFSFTASTAPAAPSTAAGIFNFGKTSAPPASTPTLFNSVTASNPQASTSAFSLVAPTSTNPQTSNSSIGAFNFFPSSNSTTNSSLGTPSFTNTGTATPASTVTGGFSFSTPAAAAAVKAPSSGFNFSTSGTPGLSSMLNNPPNSAGATNPLNFATSIVATTASLTGITSNQLPASSTSFSNFGIPVASVSSTPSSSTPLFTATQSSTLSGSTLLSTPASLSTATTTVSVSSITSAPPFCVRQLEEKLNRWLVELQEQEERFLRQATHVNQWDQVLQKGHDQVALLKDVMHTLKSDQHRLEAELDFIKGQQDELERLIEPLEAAVPSNAGKQMHQGDRQRDAMYHLAQNLDVELRQMSTDLAKVIEHLNTFSSPGLPSDPIVQVGRIISAHMDTLKWIDQNSAQLSTKLDEVLHGLGEDGYQA